MALGDEKLFPKFYLIIRICLEFVISQINEDQVNNHKISRYDHKPEKNVIFFKSEPGIYHYGPQRLSF